MSQPTSPVSDGCLVMAGVSHRTAPLELRERLALAPEAWARAALADDAATRASVLVSTCNRVEAYSWGGGRGVRTARRLARGLALAASVPLGELQPYLSVRVGSEALVHLVRVAAGLDSLVVGEEQIRGQVRAAHHAARLHGGLPPALDEVFRRAVEAGRRVHGAARLGPHPSVASAAVSVALRTPELAPAGLLQAGGPTLHQGEQAPGGGSGRVHAAPGGGVQGGCQAVVLGAGAMAKSAARALRDRGVPVTLCNRTADRAATLAAELGPGASAAPLDALPDLLADTRTRLLVGATAARRPVVDRALVDTAMARRGGRPLVLLDVALPRDFEPAVRAVPGVRLIDLDDLERLCPVDLATRRAEVDQAEAQAAREAAEIVRWLRVRAMGPSIVALRQRAEAIRAAELRRAAPHLRSLTPQQQAAVDRVTQAIVGKLLHGPTVALREAATGTATRARSRQAVMEVLRLDRTRAERRASAATVAADGQAGGHGQAAAVQVGGRPGAAVVAGEVAGSAGHTWPGGERLAEGQR